MQLNRLYIIKYRVDKKEAICEMWTHQENDSHISVSWRHCDDTDRKH